ncbi:MAG: hypothetical protein LC105_06175 [Chitinophagales bacterium]|nr:hypothetical protein [Chitinophagales bacterium]
MALDKTTLKSEIQSLLSDMENRNVDSKSEFAQALADAIEKYVKSATIVYVAGLATAPGGGAVTGTFEGSLQ